MRHLYSLRAAYLDHQKCALTGCDIKLPNCHANQAMDPKGSEPDMQQSEQRAGKRRITSSLYRVVFLRDVFQTRVRVLYN